MNSRLSEIADHLKKVSSILLCGHILPDGDCLGSVAALGNVLERMGKRVDLAVQGQLPENMLFLPGAEKFKTASELDNSEYDTFVVLDCSVPERLGEFRPYIEKVPVVVNIDHHINSTPFARYNYLDDKAAATGEIIMDLIDEMGVGLDKETASCLYVALVTDTGSFQYENTSPGTLRKAARLLEAGIPASSINISLYEERPLKVVQVLGATLERIRFTPGGRIAWAVVDRELLDRFSATDEHTDGLINFLRTIKGIEVAILIRETAPGRFKVGFRSKGEVDVHRLAGKLGGGGHKRASGCVLTGDLKQVIDRILQAAVEDVPGEEHL